MKNSSNYNKFLAASGFAVMAFLSLPAHANFSWSSDGKTCGVSISCDRTEIISGQSVDVSVSGFQATSTSTALSSAAVHVWSGLSVQSSDESYGDVPQHATDADGRKESLLFSFSKSVELTQVSMGWIGRKDSSSSLDADFSLLRYVGDGSDTDITGLSYQSLLTTAGGSWELVGNSFYSGGYVDGSGYTANVNPEGKSSSLWLVAALNDAYWSDSRYLGNDYFKLQTLGARMTVPPPPSVPEPSTLALMSLSLFSFGFVQQRRRRKQSL